MAIELTIKRTLSEEEIADVITTALEGGIGYWACLDCCTEDWAAARKTLKEKNTAAGAADPRPCYNEIVWELLSNGKKVVFFDTEADEDNLKPDEIWELTMEKFVKGLELYEQERGSIKKSLDDGEFDAIEADCVFQYALFGELVFG